MKIELDKSLELPLNPARAWDFLQDIESVAACLPGARITERVDESHYRGAVTVRLGPATVTFNGLIEVAARDVAARRMRILGTGSDAGGSSAATLDLIASIEDRDGSHSTLTGHSEVSVSGKIASFGARLMRSASDVLIKQFFENVREKASSAQTFASSPSAAAAVNNGASREPNSLAREAIPREANLGGFAFVWAVARDFFVKLFGGP